MTENEAFVWIAELFEEEPENITPEVKREDLPAWDSLGVLTLMASLDSEFDIVLSDDDLLDMKAVGDIMDLLKRNEKLM